MFSVHSTTGKILFTEDTRQQLIVVVLMNVHVSLKMTFTFKLLFTDVTSKVITRAMYELMLHQVSFPVKRFVARFALIFHRRVTMLEDVDFQVGFEAKLLSAMLALMRETSRVNDHVIFEVFLPLKAFHADDTLVRFVRVVDERVFQKVTQLTEFRITNCTHVWTSTGVDDHMLC